MKKILNSICIGLVSALVLGGCTISGKGMPEEASNILSKQQVTRQQEGKQKEENHLVQQENMDEAITLEDAELQGELRIATYTNDPYMEYAAQAFEKKHPNVHIEIETEFYNKGELTEDGKGIVSSNSGKPHLSIRQYDEALCKAFEKEEASDLINLVGLPFYNYAQKGYLYDLKATIDGEDGINDKEYYRNLIDAMQYDEGYYNMPYKIQIKSVGILKPFLMQHEIDESELTNKAWSIDDLIELVKKTEQQSGKQYNLMGMCGLEKMYGMFFLSGQEQCIDLAQHKVNFKNEAFRKSLEKMKAFVDEGYIREGDMNGIAHDDLLVQPRWCGKSYSANYDDYCVGWKPVVNEKGEAFATAYSAYGLNAKCKNKPLAWAFMKFMYSQEIQQNGSSYEGICINKAAEDERIKNEVQHYFINAIYQMNVSIEEATEEYMKWDKQCIELVGNGYIWDQVMNAIVLSTVEEYFLGEQSIEETINKLQDKVTVWLNE